jgi:hypothetical protein
MWSGAHLYIRRRIRLDWSDNALDRNEHAEVYIFATGSNPGAGYRD